SPPSRERMRPGPSANWRRALKAVFMAPPPMAEFTVTRKTSATVPFTALDLTELLLRCIYSMGGTDGGYPRPGMVKGCDGNFYGIAEVGGALNLNYGLGFGTMFKVTPDGT